MEDEQALWEVSTALGSEFDADGARARAHAAAALLKLVPTDEEPSPYDREWREGVARSTVDATVALLAGGRLDSYLSSGENATAAAEAVAAMAPIPQPEDLVFAEVMVERLYARRHPQS